MIDFNLNNYVLVQITEYGWGKLNETVGSKYIEHSILSYETIIDNEKWYNKPSHYLM